MAITGSVGRISRRVTAGIFLWSFLLAALAVAFISLDQYRKDQDEIQSTLRTIQQTDVPSLASSVFSMDMALTKVQLHNITTLDGITCAAIVDGSGGKDACPESPGRKTVVYPLAYVSFDRTFQLGDVVVQFSESSPIKVFQSKLPLMAWTFALLLILISAPLLLSIHLLVTRPLLLLKKAIDRAPTETQPIALPKRRFLQAPDEIDDLADALERNRQAIQALMQNKEQRSAELEDLLQATSHDLRTPLLNISAFSSEVADALRNFAECVANGTLAPERIPTEAQGLLGDLRFIRTGAARSYQQLVDLGQMLRIFNHTMKVGPMDPTAVLKALAKEHDAQLAALQGELVLDPLPRVLGNPEDLKNALAQLIQNSIKFRSPDRPLRIQVSGSKDKDVAWIQVIDNGIGISGLDLDKVFGLFYKADPASPGSGIGLCMAQRLIATMGGSLKLEGQLGQGTTATVQLPIPRDA